jgi:hypothetical protein
MLWQLKAPPVRELARWCLYTLILLAPGSFAVLIILWLVRLCRARASRKHGLFAHVDLTLPQRSRIGARVSLFYRRYQAAETAV